MQNLDPDGLMWMKLLRIFLNNLKSFHENRVRPGRGSDHAQFLGRCQKDEVKNMRVFLKLLGVGVLLYPRGETQKPRGKKRYRSLRHTDECAVYAKNCSAWDVFERLRIAENSVFLVPIRGGDLDE